MGSKRDATPEVGHIIERLMSANSDAFNAGVTVQADFAYPGKKGGPSVKLHGYPCAATIKNNHVDIRRRGLADVTMTIDGKHWETLSTRKREGLIAHELEHIVVLRDKTDQFKLDDADRPVTRMKIHDYEQGGFFSIAEEYGEDSHEVMNMVQMMEKRKQLFFRWADDRATRGDIPARMAISKS